MASVTHQALLMVGNSAASTAPLGWERALATVPPRLRNNARRYDATYANDWLSPPAVIVTAVKFGWQQAFAAAAQPASNARRADATSYANDWLSNKWITPAGIPDKWNSADKSASITLSNSDTTATSTAGGNAGVRTVRSHSANKYYFELATGTFNGNIFDNDGLGITTGASVLAAIAFGANTLFVRNDGLIYVGGVSTTKSTNALQGSGSGATIGFAIDLTAQRAWVRNSFNSNVWIGTTAAPTPNPATGVDGFDVSGIFGGVAVFPCMTGDNSSTDIVTFNQTLTYTPPSGFSPW